VSDLTLAYAGERKGDHSAEIEQKGRVVLLFVFLPNVGGFVLQSVKGYIGGSDFGKAACSISGTVIESASQAYLEQLPLQGKAAVGDRTTQPDLIYTGIQAE